MPVMRILTNGAPELRKKAVTVPCIDDQVKTLAKDMIETMQSEQGVGLAAPQVGKSLRLIVLQMPGQEPFALINPRIIKREGEREILEACLSIPGYEGMVKRSETIIARGFDCEGKPMRIKARDLLSQAIEHEVDHLDGILYPDRIEDKAKFYECEKTPGGTLE